MTKLTNEEKQYIINLIGISDDILESEIVKKLSLDGLDYCLEEHLNEEVSSLIDSLGKGE